MENDKALFGWIDVERQMEYAIGVAANTRKLLRF